MEIEKRFLPWPPTPLPTLSFSASGLLALADLSTIAKRTALTGTSTYLDILVLAPGIHYQQAADTFNDLPRPLSTPLIRSSTGAERLLTNAATLRYLTRVGSSPRSRPLTLSVGPAARPSVRDLVRANSLRARRRSAQGADNVLANLLGPVLYALGPCLTVAAVVVMVLTRDWWGCGIIGALMVARGLNIWIIRSRTAGTSVPALASPQEGVDGGGGSSVSSASGGDDDGPADWMVSLDGAHEICLRGLAHDLEALTTGTWMRAKTDVEGYLEAAAKLIVYLVAAFSGNMHQTGNIVLMVLLLGSAALLALSNAHEDTFCMKGRRAVVVGEGEGQEWGAPFLEEGGETRGFAKAKDEATGKQMSVVEGVSPGDVTRGDVSPGSHV